ncbi:FAD/NAD(P)-binding protein [Pediococcus acidilactici]|uniref:FAD/NAD(P)-binding protein n=1 Tax=Pediococcus acidilactici TaxID=1254 RepID=UPI000FF7D308|nr:FAD/NAD(P)-binding domain-containing protein [Pediococcus acidilactici]MDD9323369.1 FAD/NAD(P)-binding protein [Pediococcus acidilactici]RWY86762.1 oxidoreductase [Pediococcus acidilactici]
MKIALIGAGPRNLMALERLVCWGISTNYSANVEISLFDPFGIGGRVWNPDQNHELKMNSLAEKITLFTDQSIEMAGPVHEGPSLLDWALANGRSFIEEHQYHHQKLLLNELANLNKHSYSSRALFGIYQQWFYEQIINHLPDNFSVTLRPEWVTNVKKDAQQYTVITQDAAYNVDVVSAALGEGNNPLSKEERQLQDFAAAHQLKYVPIAYPAEMDVDDVAASDHVIIRGLGLSFIDYLAELTERRGGTFHRDEHGNLTYTRSGDEPTIYASSRRGLPYHARGLDQKAVGETFPRYFLSDQYVDDLVRQHQVISGEEFINRIQWDVELTYYVTLAQNSYPEIDLTAFEADLAASTKGFKKILDNYGIAAKDRLNWEEWKNPIPKDVNDAASFTQFIKTYLQQDVDLANEGNLTAPFTSAIEKLRELRTNIRKVVTYRLISADDYVEQVLKHFNSLNSFLAVGPPAFRIEQILALIKSGILTLIGPDMRVETSDDQFMTYSNRLADHQQYFGNVLIEGRLPQPNAANNTNPLVNNLLQQGLARIFTLQLRDGSSYQTGALDVTDDTAELIDQNGNVVSHFFVWGLPTEKRHWLTNGAPIPGVNDVRLRIADRIAAQIFAK